ncbi:hypothetical protein [Sphaerochaeta sp. PS]|uniref:hypothetical protein n=1 Tax=Sphaerochaeta sp. PS TaxID=3076336 RepID=UPI0028A2F177|nr:hypothetical protein [Sphaerochaeta sp. PS]MDT4761190.1 hypothetical protein [Sphaerochaeta sp. PS]
MKKELLLHTNICKVKKNSANIFIAVLVNEKNCSIMRIVIIERSYSDNNNSDYSEQEAPPKTTIITF